MPQVQVMSKCAGTAAAVALMLLAIAAIIHGLTGSGLFKPRMAGQGTIEFSGRSGGTVIAATRQIEIGSHRFWQVEVSSGVWKNCAKDCAAALRKALGP